MTQFEVYRKDDPVNPICIIDHQKDLKNLQETHKGEDLAIRPHLTIDLPGICNNLPSAKMKALKIAAMFNGYTKEPDEQGLYFRIHAYQDVEDCGIRIITNVFPEERYVKEVLFINLLKRL